MPKSYTSGAAVSSASIIAALGYTPLNAASLLRSYLTTTVTYNNTNTLADTALSVTVATGGIYAVELVVHSTSAVKGLLLDFAGTVTPANFVGGWFATIATSGDPVSTRTTRVTAMGTDFDGGVEFDGANTDYIFTGSLEVTTGGTFLLRGAQNVSDASNTTILRGSTLTLTKMN